MSLSRLAKPLGLTAEQFRRAVPFFLVYLLLFTALTIADAVAISLFASRIGAESLPGWYSATAVLSLFMIAAYLTRVTRHESGVVFGVILAAFTLLFGSAWGAYQWIGGSAPLGMLFVTREIALTMVLMHFGTFLQDFFLRAELNRILPIIYAGGRVGGIIGGGMVGWLASRIGTVNLVPVVVTLLLLAWIGIVSISKFADRADEEDEPATTSANPPPVADDEPTPTPLSPPLETVRWFLLQVGRCPLLGWLTATTLVFVGCRWFLAFQYTSFFEGYFADDVAMASFLGRYTQIALIVSLMLQLFVVNRLVGWIGVSSTHLIYCGLVCGGLLGNLFAAGLPLAVASRFLETEFRFGLRNPVNQMMVNRFTKRMRIFVRGWSLGWLIPVGTLAASGLIAGLLRLGGPLPVAIAGAVLGIALVITAVRVGRAYDEFDAGRS